MRRAGCLLALLMWMLIGSTSKAQVYEWTDADGSRHFTNSKDSVPAAEQANARVFVAERRGAPAAEPAAQPAQARDDRQVQVVYDRADVEGAYAAGVRDALAIAGAQSHSETPAVEIHGPLAVANADVRSSGFDYPYPAYPYYPLVTTSFDRGRSRHLTLRMLLQDQFQLDRDGPFFHERLNPVGLGPGLNPFLPRGLPNRIPPGTRVLFR